ncbi:hypothetical protein [Phreatobacter stygius]|uniref:Uncharacterized protein n=1 Tax=Phreatobacter stygius TaxID=1940610 RepID=A0A4D7BBT8_9HYPH|nr:hypothetical protein [Phreatobacter stygius]QCI65542.1 hypothetical protein E8M01_15800 [Phreatobacter stygius]
MSPLPLAILLSSTGGAVAMALALGWWLAASAAGRLAPAEAAPKGTFGAFLMALGIAVLCLAISGHPAFWGEVR